jgi:hypothetical protein
MGRGDSNIEDQFRSALMLLDGLKVLGDVTKHDALETALGTVLECDVQNVYAMGMAPDRTRWGSTGLRLPFEGRTD